MIRAAAGIDGQAFQEDDDAGMDLRHVRQPLP
jgi:hypothetical protein